MDKVFSFEPKVTKKMYDLRSTTPEEFQFLPEIPNSFAFEGLENEPALNLLHPDMVESRLQPTLHDVFVFENLGLLEPTPIGHNHPKASPSLDIKLLQDILNVAVEKGIDHRNYDDSSSSGNNAKRKFSFSSSSSSASLQSHLSRSKKRRSGDDAPNFRPYQETKWSEQYEELVQFKEEYGHCSVPHSYKPHLGLSRWIKRQRYQYKLRLQGKISTMTESRIQKLERIGFVWDSHAATWDQRFEELKEFRSYYGHCNVPSKFPSNPNLATWIKCQRRQYSFYFKDNKSSSMTPKRIAQLEAVGFKWRVREDYH